jgi:hypothetical protein
MIGHSLSPILTEIEMTILEHEVNAATPPEYTMDAFRAATKIFMSAVVDKMWAWQEANGIVQPVREATAEQCGNELREFVMKYTGIDTLKLYEV